MVTSQDDLTARAIEVVEKSLAPHIPRQDPVDGYSVVASFTKGPLKDLEVGRLRLTREGGAFTGKTKDRETVLHVLVGKCDITIESPNKQVFHDLGDRRDLFSGPSTSLILSPGTVYSVVPSTRTVDLAIASIPAQYGRREPLVIRPSDVEVHIIGEGSHQREVREVFGGERAPYRIRIGETINPPGHWSSWPKHDFEYDMSLAPQFEEVFLYFTKPRAGWGLQRVAGCYVNGETVDDVWVVKNGDAGVIPLGDHPVVGSPDTTLLYIWFYVSPIPKVYSKWAEDYGGYA